MKKYLSFAALLIVVIVAYFVFMPRDTDTVERPADATSPLLLPKNTPLSATYEVDGEKITLVNGKNSEEIISSPASTISTELFGEPVYGTVQGMDGSVVAATFLIQQGGGTGTFVYVVAAVRGDGRYGTFIGTNAIFLGDRVAPQNIRIVDGVIEVNYATRKENEPMSAEPSVGVTKRLILKNGKLVEAYQSL